MIDRYDLRVAENGLPYLKKVGDVNADSEKSLDNSTLIADTAREIFAVDELSEEYVWLMGFNTKLWLKGVLEIAHGSDRLCPASISSILKRALLLNASRFVLVHNHPSGSKEPSPDDKVTTERLKEAFKLCDLSLLDHIIIPANKYGYFSFIDEGLM